MVTWEDVAGLALALPATEEGVLFRTRAWKAGGQAKPRAFAWVRPLSAKDERDMIALGRPVPTGEFLGLRVASPEDKAAVLEQFADSLFTIPHFDRSNAVLVRLDAVEPELLKDLILDAWLAVAPPKLARAHLAEPSPDG